MPKNIVVFFLFLILGLVLSFVVITVFSSNNSYPRFMRDVFPEYFSNESITKTMDSQEIYFSNIDVTSKVSFAYTEEVTEDITVTDNIALADYYAFMSKIQESEKSWENWNYENYYVVLRFSEEVKQYDNEDVVLVLPNKGIELPEKLEISCPYYSSSMVSSKNIQPLEVTVNVLEEFNSNTDMLYAYCIDESCSSVGKSCIIYREEDINSHEIIPKSEDN